MRISSTFGAPSGAFAPGMIVQSATDWLDRPPDRAAEVLVGDRQHRPIGHELAHRLREPVLERLHPLLVRLHNRLRERTRKRLLDREPLRVIKRGDDPGSPRRQVLTDLVVHLRLEPLVDELADQATRDRARSSDRKQRRRRQAHQKTHAPAPLNALTTAMIRRLRNRDGAVMGVRDQDRGLHHDLLALDELRQRVEILHRPVDVRITTHEDVSRCLGHHLLLSVSKLHQSRAIVSLDITGTRPCHCRRSHATQLDICAKPDGVAHYYAGIGRRRETATGCRERPSRSQRASRRSSQADLTAVIVDQRRPPGRARARSYSRQVSQTA